MNTIEVSNPNLKLDIYLGKPIKVKKHGQRIEGWQPTLVTYRLPEGWSPLTPPTKNNRGDDVHAIGPAGATVTTTPSGMTNLLTPTNLPTP